MKKHPLRRWREGHDKTITLAELSKLAGVGQPYLSEIESWKKRPSLEVACKLSELTGISVCDFNEKPAKDSTDE